MAKKIGAGSRVFDGANYLALFLYAVSTVFPFIYVILISFASPEELTKRVLIPTHFSLQAYQYVFSTNTVARSLLVSISMTVIGTLFNIFMTSIMAYPLAHKTLMGKRIIMLMVTFTLIFDGGMIPTFIVVQKLGMLNSFSSILIPTAIKSFNLIIFINFFKQLPAEIEESAKMDGCNDLRILFSIVLPLSMPLIATFIVLYGVDQWNAWFYYILYISDANKWPIQVILRQIIASVNASLGDAALMHDMAYVPPRETIRMCVITIATVPILCVYPFIQKYFVKGIYLGSVKG